MRQKTAISDIILLTLEKAIDGIVRYDDLIHHSGQYVYGSGWDKPLKKNSLAQALRRLRLDGYIDLEEFNNRLVLKLTDTGKIEADLRKALLDDDWDGKWRVITFDIPEKHNRVRNVLRSKLKVWGFIQWQRSVWASKKDVNSILKEFIKKLGIEKWVVMMETIEGPF